MHSFLSLFTVLYLLSKCLVLCSHKKNVLDFLDQLSSVYQQKYILTSAVEVDGTQAFIEEICKLAESNGLPSKGYRSSLSEFSAGEVRRHLSEVILVALPFLNSTSAFQ
jgi:UDP-glucose:glycoprotein glucosyltransferase